MYNPYTKIKVRPTYIFVPCYAGEHYSGIDYADINNAECLNKLNVSCSNDAF